MICDTAWDAYRVPLKFKEAYAWYVGSNRSGEEQFWCGKEGWVYLQ